MQCDATLPSSMTEFAAPNGQAPTPEDVLNDFRAQIAALTLRAACGREYVRVVTLREWLHSIYPETKQSQLERLLYACMPSAQSPRIRPFFTPEQLKLKKFIILLGTLCLIGHSRYLEQLWQRPFFRSHLPDGREQLKRELNAAGIPEADTVALSFFKAQWRFCPVIFRLDDDYQHGPNHVLPIVRRKLINKKSQTADLEQVEILEEFVDKMLQARVPQSRYDHHDGLGWRYQFALKTYRGESLKHHFYREKTNFANLRNHKGMINCLNTFLHREFDASDRVSMDGEQSSTEACIFTYNFLLEYGDRDLDTYFVQVVPPFLEPEIALFWKELFEVVKAVAEIHYYTNPDKGRQDTQYNGFHADIKPANILMVEGKCKLADFGYTKFVQGSGSEARTYLPGATWKYSAPEHLPTKKEKVTQAVDIWSLGCVFSIAATWIVGGYASVRDYTRVREKAIQRIKKEQQSTLRSLEDGDLFCDGTRVLEDVTHWHKVLRMSLRQSDNITRQVLDIVDDAILLEAPTKRIKCRELCRKLEEVIKGSPVDPQKQLPQSILKALQDINDEAPRVPPLPSSSTSKQPTTGSTGTAPERKDTKAQILNTPLRKTAYREEYLKSVLGDRPRTASESMPSSIKSRQSAGEQDIDKPATAIRRQKSPEELSISVIETRDRSSAPHDGLDIFQIDHQIRSQKNTHLGRLGWRKHFVVEDIARYCKHCDFKFMVDNGWSMNKHWAFVSFALRNLAMTASPLDDNGMDLTFTRGGDDFHHKNGETLAQSLSKPGNAPKKGVETDMHEALSRIFNEHLIYLNSHRISNPKRLLLIVLTDGVWSQKTNLDDIVKKIVDFLRRLKRKFPLIIRPYCIQFVQFGHDPAATDRLRFLDDYLCSDADLLDAIDTEHVLGDVKKMFLGSHVPEYDLLPPVFASPTASSPSPPANEDAVQSFPDLSR